MKRSIIIRDNLERVRERISEAAHKAGRSESEITIVGVTKTFGPEVVTAAVEAGIEDIGENRIQEFLAKSTEVGVPCRWHLVGHLQTNKVNKAVGRFELIHSVDSLKLAEKLSVVGMERGVATKILLEVNTSGETSKYGFAPEEIVEVSDQIILKRGLTLKGLMTVGPWVADTAVVAKAFETLRRCKEEIENKSTDYNSIQHLSMGMTDDFEIAIAEGSTMVRLGRVLFGERGVG
ncbi:MAG: YggS family pyridoxal phosphate-dependent enzyme [bacterium]|nr:MAG: YggS family pyridoxal phosphate-dependent enzyme [bacterium]